MCGDTSIMIAMNVELNTCRQKVTFAGIELDTKTEPEEDKQDHLEKVHCHLMIWLLY